MTLDENDFLTFQLYTAAKTSRIKNARIRSWILITIIFFCLSYLFYSSENEPLGHYFLILAVLSLILYPFYSRWRYKNHYLKYIREVYKNKFGETCEIEFTNDTIVTRDKSGELKLNKAELEEINEIQDYYFIKTKTGASLIISKKTSDEPQKLSDEFKLWLKNSIFGGM